ncbi:GyrI-like domain-containing protein [Clostridium sp. DL1XJH146]
MEKIDYKKELSQLYKPRKGTMRLVDVPKMKYLMVDGEGNPNTSEDFKKCVEAMYSLAYSIKFISKEKGQDYVVMPLEGLWYADDLDSFVKDEKGKWKWTLIIMQPENIGNEIFEIAKEKAKKKKKFEKIDEIRFDIFDEGMAAQRLYIGDYSEEKEAIAELHEFIKENGLEKVLYHHEIYLSDARKTDPEKLKTILRQPCRKEQMK